MRPSLIVGVLAALGVFLLLPVRALADATTFHYTESDLLGYTVTNPCDGEGVVVSRTGYLEFTVTIEREAVISKLITTSRM